jgi:hypothetical protein
LAGAAHSASAADKPVRITARPDLFALVNDADLAISR